MICQNRAQGVSKNEYYRTANLQNSTLLWVGSPSLKMFFDHFIQRLGGINRSQVSSMRKFGPTASNFCYDFWAENGLLGPKNMCHIFPYFLGALDPTES